LRTIGAGIYEKTNEEGLEQPTQLKIIIYRSCNEKEKNEHNSIQQDRLEGKIQRTPANKKSVNLTWYTNPTERLRTQKDCVLEWHDR